jgi:hypothetical protein
MSDDDEDVPHVGRGRLGAGFPLGHVVKILMLVAALVAVILMRSACAQGVANWFNVVAPPVAPPAAADGGAPH